MHFICTQDADEDAVEIWHSASSDTHEADNDYLYKEGWLAGPNTTLEDFPQAQPYGYMLP